MRNPHYAKRTFTSGKSFTCPTERSPGINALDLRRIPSTHVVTPAKAGVQKSFAEHGIDTNTLSNE